MQEYCRLNTTILSDTCKYVNYMTMAIRPKHVDIFICIRQYICVKTAIPLHNCLPMVKYGCLLSKLQSQKCGCLQNELPSQDGISSYNKTNQMH